MKSPDRERTRHLEDEESSCQDFIITFSFIFKYCDVPCSITETLH